MGKRPMEGREPFASGEQLAIYWDSVVDEVPHLEGNLSTYSRC